MNLTSVPLTYHWLIRKSIGRGIKTVLDVGCGDGEFISYISKGEKWKITGVDQHKSSILEAEKKGVYKKIYKSDVVHLPHEVRKSKYDLVFCSQVLEHLSKRNGKAAIKEWEKLSKRRIIITTPVKFIPYDRIEKDEKSENPYNIHLSGWAPEEFLKLGYSVRGQGSKLVYGKNGLLRKFPRLYWPPLILLSYLISILIYYRPYLATYLIAVKNK
ncbi:MAG: hypothetical protein US75_C0002G0028 [Candidatus Woesebacteria bacterium GW2011_GWC1_38_13]|uniref:Methyltransferase domain-containing protein n=3 Tax=Candidatus Woeseibacteriota TaxID=1752722 RepID=A0A0G0P4D5_9BACT|nr:MAG: hypothetical protein US67_C0012G0005 [Candidatus Woesebacteria bacterium GW2011_GWD1_38_10]KKQ56830.1 MAG: hypothetical protein US75_C0002G0028 [Candidatus Woesebacteria bacterium GW2011_GWC1_38_13]KKQ84156.1 MAG: hypothetical protein UT06_C0009G0013 [Candidatus Woesebacteria bacterium GW2011_GWA1_38_8]